MQNLRINQNVPKHKPAVSHEAVRDWLMAITKQCASKALRPSCHYVATALAVAFLNRQTGACFPKVETIAEETGLPESTVKAALKLLKESGFLEWGRAWFNGPSSYRFVTSGSLAHKTPIDTSGSLAGETCESLAGETYKPRIETVNNKPVPSGPPLGSAPRHASHGFDSSFQSESHFVANVVARARS